MRTAFVIIIILAFTLSIYSQNNQPVAIADTFQVVSQMPTLLNVLSNDFDPDGDDIYINRIISISNGTGVIKNGMIEFTSYPSNGDAYIRYEIADNAGNPLLGETRVDIDLVPNPEIPITVNDTFSLMKLLPYQLDVLQNDYDPNGRTLKIGKITSITNCTVEISEDSLSVTVTPSIYNKISFGYRAQQTGNGTHYQSMGSLVKINAIENPDIPIALPDSATVTGGEYVDIPVLINDIDPQGETLEIFEIGDFIYGSYEIIQNNILRYYPPLSLSGRVQFIYNIREVNDTSIYSNFSQIRINVTKNPNCPIAVNDTVYGMYTVPITIDVLSNDYDINNDMFRIKDVSEGRIENNKIVFTSSAIDKSPFLIEYRIVEVNNYLSYSDKARVTVYLSANPDLPLSTTDYVTAHAGIPILIDPLSNDQLNTSDTLILASSTSLNLKGITGDSLNYVIYTPVYQAYGRDSLEYIANDGKTPILRGLICVDISSQNFDAILDINNIRAKVHANGYLFNDYKELPGVGMFDDMNPYYRFPANGLNSSIFSSCLWTGGLDANDSLHMAGERFKQQGIDFKAGPISNTYDQNYYLKYSRVWKIDRSEIDFHRQNFYKEGYEPIEAISSWPGNGDVSKGEAAILAPFGDNNNDGLYRWQDGDYPLIRGDQTIYFIYNDDFTHSETNGAKMKVEIHGMVYGFDDFSDSAIYNSVFVHYDIINRSANTYHDSYFSIFTDIDLGCADDDYVGCDVTRGSFYAYNSSDYDCVSEHGSYGMSVPAQSVTILCGPYIDGDGLDNSAGNCDASINGYNFGNGIEDDERYGMTAFSYFNNNNPGIGGYMNDPLKAQQYYNYMLSYWLDGTHLLYGGNGHNSTGALNTECKYMFPSDSDPLNYGTSCVYPGGGYNQNKFWNEEETGNIPGDRRGLGIMGPVTFKPGDIQEIEVAYCTGYNENGAIASLNNLFSNIDSLFAKVDNGEIILPNDLLGIESSKERFHICIYPNPTTDFIKIKGKSDQKNIGYQIYNLIGLKVREGNCCSSSSKSIDVTDLQNGVYLIRLNDCNQQQVFKFIKQ